MIKIATHLIVFLLYCSFFTIDLQAGMPTSAQSQPQAQEEEFDDDDDEDQDVLILEEDVDYEYESYN